MAGPLVLDDAVDVFGGRGRDPDDALGPVAALGHRWLLDSGAPEAIATWSTVGRSAEGLIRRLGHRGATATIVDGRAAVAPRAASAIGRSPTPGIRATARDAPAARPTRGARD